MAGRGARSLHAPPRRRPLVMPRGGVERQAFLDSLPWTQRAADYDLLVVHQSTAAGTDARAERLGESWQSPWIIPTAAVS